MREQEFPLAWCTFMDQNTRGRGDEPNRILLVTIYHMLYHITEEVLHQDFSPHGLVEKIVISQKSVEFQALIQYESHQSAICARNFLQGRYIYDGCCQLDIEFSTFDVHDITNPTASVEYKTENRHAAHVDTAHMEDSTLDVSNTDDLMSQTKQVEVPDMVKDIELVELIELEECDASILLDDIASLEGEKGVAANLNSVKTVDRIKKVVENECKDVVPSAHIFALAAKDFVFNLGEQDWSINPGSLDFVSNIGVRDWSEKWEKKRRKNSKNNNLSHVIGYGLVNKDEERSRDDESRRGQMSRKCRLGNIIVLCYLVV
ncbi:hypothetical protein CASFOL_027303 [Castilleja foliolosa]|uniref:Plant heme peroxidase family profile domain-containing protein n=1 Tax=Castilleja foliolosa TaxID=1961234 RepID=A0ABD3CFA6_9LAMI